MITEPLEMHMTSWHGAEASARLARVITEARRVAVGSPDLLAYEVLFEVLDVKDAESSVALRRISRLWSHPVTVRRDTLRSGVRISANESATLVNIETQFAKGTLNIPWSEWIGTLGTTIVPDLQAIARLLDPTGSVLSATVPLDTIIQFRKRLVHCLEDVSVIELPSDVSEYFEDHLMALIDALDDYRVGGTAGIDLAVSRAVSAYPSIAAGIPTRSSRLRDALITFTAAAALVGVVTQDAQQIGDLVQKLPWSQSQDQVAVHGEKDCAVIEVGSGETRQRLTVDFDATGGK
jgi:hypothetical protein